MRQRGRLAAGQLSVVTNIDAHQRQVQPPSRLLPAECNLFNKVVASMPPGFFQKSDVPMLVNYVQTRLFVRYYIDALRDDPFNVDLQKLWVQAVRLQTTLETKLRITPHSRIGPKATARQLANPPVQSYCDRVRTGQTGAETEEDEAS